MGRGGRKSGCNPGEETSSPSVACSFTQSYELGEGLSPKEMGLVVYHGHRSLKTLPSKSTPQAMQSRKKIDESFAEILQLIAASREKAFQSVNTTLIDLYWEVGATISRN